MLKNPYAFTQLCMKPRHFGSYNATLDVAKALGDALVAHYKCVQNPTVRRLFRAMESWRILEERIIFSRDVFPAKTIN